MLRRLSLPVVLLIVLLAGATRALAYTPAQNWDLSRINSVRSAHKVSSTLPLGSNMTTRAQTWANQLAFFNMDATDDTAGAQVCWNAGGHFYGANAATGFASYQAAQYALEGSSIHLANMVGGRYQWVGIGIAQNNQGYVVIQDFCGK